MTEYLDKYQITGITGTPLVWRDFLKTLPSDYHNQTLRYLTVSGGSLMKSYLQELQKVFPNARIIRTYGQTETFRTFINHDIEDPSLGRLITDTHVELTSNQELIHYGPTSMLGYLFEETVREHSPQWGYGINTKDVMMCEKGNYYFQSRSDDVVKRFEQRFHLSEIEHFFRSLPGVNEAIAIVTPTDSGDWRQYYLAVFILPNEGTNLDIKLITTIAESSLSYYKKPDHLFHISEIPQTSSYKVDRAALKLRLNQELNRA
jgi:acyl-coenzyme A synthetase/AMP-(fatty) acid ligase